MIKEKYLIFWLSLWTFQDGGNSQLDKVGNRREKNLENNDLAQNLVTRIGEASVVMRKHCHGDRKGRQMTKNPVFVI